MQSKSMSVSVAERIKKGLCVSNPVPGTIKPAPVAGLIFKRTAERTGKTNFHPTIDEFMKAVKSQNPPPYILPVIRSNKTEQVIEYYYWSLAENKYIRKKVRAFSRGVKSTKAQRLAVLKQTLPVVTEEFLRRNEKGLYHETYLNPIGGKTYIAYIEQILSDDKIPQSTRRTIANYKSSFTRFQADKLYTPINVTAEVLENFRSFLQAEGKANKTINEYLWAAQLVSEYLKKKAITQKSVNTTDLHVRKIKNQTMRYRPLTFQEKDTIFNHFRTANPHFNLFLLSVYYTCIRPGELRRLQIKLFTPQYVTVPWYAAKNGLTQQVQILAPLQEALADFNISAMPKSLYLFGKNFLPGPDPYNGKHTSDFWREACNHLGISKDAMLYGLKHTFNLDYVENNKTNIDWEWLRRHNRHSTVRQTQDYIYNLTPHMLDETKNIILNHYKNT